jgi:hypothetical protein
MQNQMRLSFREMISPIDDEWAVINDHEQRVKRLEKLLLELKMKFQIEEAKAKARAKNSTDCG